MKDKYGDPMVNIVWPGFVIFPDFSHPNTSTFWIQMLEAFYFSTEGLNGAPFDGLWIGEFHNFKV